MSYEPTRREFLVGCSAAIAAMAGARVGAFAFDPSASGRDILVVLFLRGGMDGLHLLGPIDDKDYIAARPVGLRLNEKGDHAGLALPNAHKSLDFRLHKAAEPLLDLYTGGHLALVHACGLKHGTRSHFEAMDLMERGVVGSSDSTLGTGWLTRTLSAVRANTGVPAVSVEGSLPDSLLGSRDAISMNDIGAFNLYGGKDQISALRALYAGDDPIRRAGSEALDVYESWHAKLERKPDGGIADYRPRAGVTYPNTDLARRFQTVARSIKMDLGLRVATLDFGGWDTHQNQEWVFRQHVGELAGALRAFYEDLSDVHARLNVVVMSEFGRRLKANQSYGTDHGHGNVMMVLGGNVKGGMHGRWPGLATEQLDERVDLAVTTDYRTVIAEVLSKRMGVAQVAPIFPGYKPEPTLGIVR